MPSNLSSWDRDPLDRLAEEFVERYRRGERPPLSEYLERNSELADEIRELFPALVAMEQLKPGNTNQTGAYLDDSPLDVKPSNLLLDAWGIVWVTDFGLARATEAEDVTNTDDILDNLRCLATERFEGNAPTAGREDGE